MMNEMEINMENVKMEVMTVENVKAESVKTESIKAGNVQAENGGDSDRTHRVGTITCGFIFVLYGILFLLHMILPQLNYKILFDLWPVVLISVGVEILAACTHKNQENVRVVYDFPAVLLIMLLTLFAFIMAAVSYGLNISYYEF